MLSATTPAATPLGYDASGHTIQAHTYAYRRAADQDAAVPAHHPVVVVGAGPVGLSLAIDLAQRGCPVLLLDDDHKLSTGSRAICFAKRTLDVWDRLGVGDAMCAKGVEWNVGKVFFGQHQLYQFNLQPEAGHARPAFINLQQYYAEAYLAVRAAALPNIETRWCNNVVAISQTAAGVVLGVDTPDGRYTLQAGYVAACDGSRSPLRALLGQERTGRVFRDRFLIADVKMAVDFPAERWFWFDPPFHPNQSVLLHRQPDGVWRIDFQLGWDADPELEKQPQRIRPRVDAMMLAALGRVVPFTLEWASVYTFACQRMASFRHGRVLFAGDAAHGVSPFGARGANSGVQDAENLGWKLAAVLHGQAPDALLNSYAAEREFAADENLLNASRATDFITPKSEISHLFRDAVLRLSQQHAFARTLVNSGRLSVPCTLHGSSLNTPDGGDHWPGHMRPGAAAADAPVSLRGDHLDGQAGQPGWLLRQLGDGFTALLAAGGDSAALTTQLRGHQTGLPPLKLLTVHAAGAAAHPSQPGSLIDSHGLVAQRYGLQPGSLVLLRPDQHVCARWRQPTAGAVQRAMQQALAIG